MKKSIKLVATSIIFFCAIVVSSGTVLAKDIEIQGIPVDVHFNSGQNQLLMDSKTAKWSTAWGGGNGNYSMRFYYGDGKSFTYNGNGTSANISHTYQTTLDRRYSTQLYVSSGGSSDIATGYVQIRL